MDQTEGLTVPGACGQPASTACLRALGTWLQEQGKCMPTWLFSHIADRDFILLKNSTSVALFCTSAAENHVGSLHASVRSKGRLMHRTIGPTRYRTPRSAPRRVQTSFPMAGRRGRELWGSGTAALVTSIPRPLELFSVCEMLR